MSDKDTIFEDSIRALDGYGELFRKEIEGVLDYVYAAGEQRGIAAAREAVDRAEMVTRNGDTFLAERGASLAAIDALTEAPETEGGDDDEFNIRDKTYR